MARAVRAWLNGTADTEAETDTKEGNTSETGLDTTAGSSRAIMDHENFGSWDGAADYADHLFVGFRKFFICPNVDMLSTVRQQTGKQQQW